MNTHCCSVALFVQLLSLSVIANEQDLKTDQDRAIIHTALHSSHNESETAVPISVDTSQRLEKRNKTEVEQNRTISLFKVK